MTMRAFMARSERETAPKTEAPRTTPPSAPAVRTVAPSTSVDATSEVEGTLRCKETLRIDGRVKGAVTCEKTVLVGESARVEASIDADEVKISGLVEGNIAARRKITLERTAVVTGDLTTPGIVIEEGAKLKGRIVIGSDEMPATATAAAAEEEEEEEATKSAKDAKKASAPRKAPSGPTRPEDAAREPANAVV